MNNELTPRESDVMQHLITGDSNIEIAAKLDLAVVTVKLHVRGICRKYDVKTRARVLACIIANLRVESNE